MKTVPYLSFVSSPVVFGAIFLVAVATFTGCPPGNGMMEGSGEGSSEGSGEGGGEGMGEGSGEGVTEGVGEGMSEGSGEGATEGSSEGSGEGGGEGGGEGSSEGATEGVGEGMSEGSGEGATEGSSEGSGEGVTEGVGEGMSEGSGEGASEGVGEGMSEGSGEGATEGGGEGTGEAMTFVFEQGVDGYAGFEDTTIYEDFSNRAGGGIDGIFVGTIRTSPLRRALVRADLTMIPPGSVVVSASLELIVDMSGGNSTEGLYGIHRLLADWGEGNANDPGSLGGIGADASSGDATWIENFFEQTMWAMAGGDFVPEASAEQGAGQQGAAPVWTGADVAADVQHWVDNPGENFGWMIVQVDEGLVVRRTQRYHSSEAQTNRPRLVVEVTLPVGGAMDE